MPDIMKVHKITCFGDKIWQQICQKSFFLSVTCWTLNLISEVILDQKTYVSVLLIFEPNQLPLQHPVLWNDVLTMWRKNLFHRNFFFGEINSRYPLWDVCILWGSYNSISSYFQNFWYCDICLMIKWCEINHLHMHWAQLRP